MHQILLINVKFECKKKTPWHMWLKLSCTCSGVSEHHVKPSKTHAALSLPIISSGNSVSAPHLDAYSQLFTCICLLSQDCHRAAHCSSFQKEEHREVSELGTAASLPAGPVLLSGTRWCRAGFPAHFPGTAEPRTSCQVPQELPDHSPTTTHRAELKASPGMSL